MSGRRSLASAPPLDDGEIFAKHKTVRRRSSLLPPAAADADDEVFLVDRENSTPSIESSAASSSKSSSVVSTSVTSLSPSTANPFLERLKSDPRYSPAAIRRSSADPSKAPPTLPKSVASTPKSGPATPKSRIPAVRSGSSTPKLAAMSPLAVRAIVNSNNKYRRFGSDGDESASIKTGVCGPRPSPAPLAKNLSSPRLRGQSTLADRRDSSLPSAHSTPHDAAKKTPIIRNSSFFTPSSGSSEEIRTSGGAASSQPRPEGSAVKKKTTTTTRLSTFSEDERESLVGDSDLELVEPTPPSRPKIPRFIHVTEEHAHILDGIHFYVEVYGREDQANRSASIADQITKMGGTCHPRLNGKVTHVVFRDGRGSTYEKAKKKGLHLVNVLWLEYCKWHKAKVLEIDYKADPPPLIEQPDPFGLGLNKGAKRYARKPRSLTNLMTDSESRSAERIKKRKKRLERKEKLKSLESSPPKPRLLFDENGEELPTYSQILASETPQPFVRGRVSESPLDGSGCGGSGGASPLLRKTLNDSGGDSLIRRVTEKNERVKELLRRMRSSSDEDDDDAMTQIAPLHVRLRDRSFKGDEKSSSSPRPSSTEINAPSTANGLDPPRVKGVTFRPEVSLVPSPKTPSLVAVTKVPSSLSAWLDEDLSGDVPLTDDEEEEEEEEQKKERSRNSSDAEVDPDSVAAELSSRPNVVIPETQNLFSVETAASSSSSPSAGAAPTSSSGVVDAPTRPSPNFTVRRKSKFVPPFAGDARRSSRGGAKREDRKTTTTTKKIEDFFRKENQRLETTPMEMTSMEPTPMEMTSMEPTAIDRTLMETMISTTTMTTTMEPTPRRPANQISSVSVVSVDASPDPGVNGLTSCTETAPECSDDDDAAELSSAGGAGVKRLSSETDAAPNGEAKKRRTASPVAEDGIGYTTETIDGSTTLTDVEDPGLAVRTPDDALRIASLPQGPPGRRKKLFFFSEAASPPDLASSPAGGWASSSSPGPSPGAYLASKGAGKAAGKRGGERRRSKRLSEASAGKRTTPKEGETLLDVIVTKSTQTPIYQNQISTDLNVPLSSVDVTNKAAVATPASLRTSVSDTTALRLVDASCPILPLKSALSESDASLLVAQSPRIQRRVYQKLGSNGSTGSSGFAILPSRPQMKATDDRRPIVISRKSGKSNNSLCGEGAAGNGRGHDGVAASAAASTAAAAASRPSLEDFDLGVVAAAVRKTKTRSASTSSTASVSSSAQRSSQLKEAPPPLRKRPINLVATSCHRDQRALVKSAVKTLGGVVMTASFSPSTTHLISGEPRRTLNILRAVARGGVWILSLEWIVQSVAAGRWLEEEPFECVEDFPSCRAARQDPRLPGAVFSCVGRVFVDAGCAPPTEELAALLSACGAKTTSTTRNADLVVTSRSGAVGGGAGARKTKAAPSVEPTWVLDSITNLEAVDLKEYLKEPEIESEDIMSQEY